MNKDITPLNDKSQRHGLWDLYSGDKSYFKRFYHNNKAVGYGEGYYYRCKLKDKIYFL
jgi:hypothetical protein